MTIVCISSIDGCISNGFFNVTMFCLFRSTVIPGQEPPMASLLLNWPGLQEMTLLPNCLVGLHLNLAEAIRLSLATISDTFYQEEGEG